MGLIHFRPDGSRDRCRCRRGRCPYGGPHARSLSRKRLGAGGEVSSSFGDVDYSHLPLASLGGGAHGAALRLKAEREGASISEVFSSSVSLAGESVVESASGPSGSYVESGDGLSVGERFLALSESERAAVLERVDASVVPGAVALESASAWLESASDEEVSALRRYSTSEFFSVNGFLSQGEDCLAFPRVRASSSDKEKEEVRLEKERFMADVEAITSGLDSLMARSGGFGEPGLFYRGLNFRELRDGRGVGTVSVDEGCADVLERFPVGEGVSASGYMSTSTSEKVAYRFTRKSSIDSDYSQSFSVVMRVHGRGGLSVAPVSRTPEECEVLFPRDGEFIVGRSYVEGKGSKKTVFVDVYESGLLSEALDC